MAEPSKAFGLGLKSLVIDDRGLRGKGGGLGEPARLPLGIQPYFNDQSETAGRDSLRTSWLTSCLPSSEPKRKPKIVDPGDSMLKTQTPNSPYSADSQILHRPHTDINIMCGPSHKHSDSHTPMSPAHMPQLISITMLPAHTSDIHTLLTKWPQADSGASNSASNGKTTPYGTEAPPWKNLPMGDT